MNILYIGPYRQQDGWGRASRDYLKALSLTKHNIVSRPIWLSNHITNYTDEFLLDLESKVLDTRPDCVIQNVLPYFGEYQHGMKNILQMYLETSPLTHTNWPTYMNFFEEIWVPTKTELEMVKENAVNTPTNIIPMPFDLDNMDRDIEPLNIPELNDDDFVFYFIGEYIERKNLMALLIAFHTEFKTTENARLVIKTNLSGVNPTTLKGAIEDNIIGLCKNMRVYSKNFGYIPEIILTHNMSYEDILKLHKRCDCLVMPSRGESTCRPVIEALAMGNQVILTKNTGMEWATSGYTFAVDSHKTPAICSKPPFEFIYTANETWQEIDIYKLKQTMRDVYNGAKKNDARDMLEKTSSYKAVASLMDEVLI